MNREQYDFSMVYYRIENAWKHKGFRNATEFSKASGIKPGTISAWKNSNSIPSIEYLMKICNTCDCDIDYLLGKITTFKRTNQTIQDETGFSEDVIESLIAEKERAKKGFEQLEEIFDAPINPHSTRIQLAETVIRNWDNIADNIDFINRYRIQVIALDGFDIGMMTKVCSDIHSKVNSEFERWNVFRDWFLNEYGDNYDDNFVYHTYMVIVNSQAINAARLAISQEFDRITDEMTRPISGATASKDK